MIPEAIAAGQLARTGDIMIQRYCAAAWILQALFQVLFRLSFESRDCSNLALTNIVCRVATKSVSNERPYLDLRHGIYWWKHLASGNQTGSHGTFDSLILALALR
jgi:hypothetical protein